jgi:hypothetical protein
MSTPHVAGIAAYMRALAPGISPDAIAQLIRETADDLTDPYGDGSSYPGPDLFSGAGRVNLARAIAAVPAWGVRLTAPAPQQIISGVIGIYGIVVANEGDYIIEYGAGDAPTEWIETSRSATTDADGLIGIWNTSTLNGVFTVRLRSSTERVSTATIFVANRPHAELTAPIAHDTVPSLVTFTGSAYAAHFREYVIEFGLGQQPKEWTEVHRGTKPVADGLLGEWYPDTVAEGDYAIRVLVIDSTGAITGDTVAVYVRPPLAGNLGWKTPVTAPSWTHACNYGDFDHDGQNEIVVGTADGLQIFNLDGTTKIIPGLSDITNQSVSVPVAVGDLDGDGIGGDLAIITDNGTLLLYPSTETPLTIHTAPPRGVGGWDPYLRPYICLKDLDGDRRDEIQYYAGGHSTGRAEPTYLIYDARGRVLFADSLPNGLFIAADLDNNQRDELYVVRDKLYRLPFNGYSAASVELPTAVGERLLPEYLVATDIDGDGLRDLILLAGSDRIESHVMYAFDGTPAMKATWPRTTGIASFAVPSAPAFFDMDGDGKLEYGIGWQTLTYGLFSVWNSDGTSWTGDSSAIFARTSDPGNMVTVRAADIDSDNLIDLLTYTVPDVYYWNPRERLFAWDQSARVKDGWPYVIETGSDVLIVDQQPIVGDLNADGRTDVTSMTSAGNLVFYDIPGSAFNPDMAPATQWRMNPRHNNSSSDDDPFHVHGVRPTRFERDLKDTTTVTLSFSSPINPATLTDTTVRLSSRFGDVYPGVTTIAADRLSLSFKPDGHFAVGDHVTLTVATELGAMQGPALRQPFVSSFDLPPGKVGLVTLSPGESEEAVHSGMPIMLTFGESLDPTSLSNLTVTMIGSQSGIMAVALSLQDNLRTLVARPTHPATEPEEIRVTVKGTIRMLSGSNWTVDEAWSYRTRAFDPVASTVPRVHSTAIDPAAPIVINLTDEPDPATIDSATTRVRSSRLGRISGVVSYDAQHHRIIFQPERPLPVGDRITVSLSGIVNASGAYWPRGHQWEFETGTASTLGQFGTLKRFPQPGLSYVVGTGDFDGDGFVDLIAGGAGVGDFHLFRNNGAGELIADTVYELGLSPRAICVADFNDDGRQDIVLNEFDNRRIPILYGTGDGRFRVELLHGAMHGLGNLIAADLDSDGDQDIAAVHLTAEDIDFFENLGEESFRVGRIVPTAQPLAMTTLDLDRDGDLDIALIANSDQRTVVEILINQGDFEFVSTLTYPLVEGRSIRGAIVSGDLNGDGFADIVVSAAAVESEQPNHILATLSGDSLGQLGALRVITLDFKPDQLLIADLDGATGPDIVLTTPTPGGFGIFLNDGAGVLHLDMRYGGSRPFAALAPLDIDSDGDLDLEIAGYFHGAHVFVNDALCICESIGEISDDGVIDAADATTLVDYLFRQAAEPTTDRFCPAVNRADLNCDDDANIADLIILIDYLYREGPPPCDPCWSE